MAYELSREGNSEVGLIFVVNRPPILQRSMPFIYLFILKIWKIYPKCVFSMFKSQTMGSF